jgi:Uma2 family endonuclease
VVEILSPRTAYYDLKKKFKVYERHGVGEYWIVDPEDRSIAIYENREGKFMLAREVAGKGEVESKILLGFHLENWRLYCEDLPEISVAPQVVTVRGWD